MFELITMFLTAGGSAAMGSILKGVFGTITDSKQHKFDLEMAREARNNEFVLKYQEIINSGDGGSYTRITRRILALIGMCTLSAISLLCTIYPSIPILTSSNITGEGTKSILFGLFTFPVEQTPVVLTTGHASLFAISCVYPLIIGFYFTPGGRR